MSQTLTIRNVPDLLARKLKTRAERNHRSLQGEVMAILEQAESKLTIEEIWERGKRLGLSTPNESARIVRKSRDERYGS